ncbi:fungal-specific transcription factor domain-containing protein, partial [Mycena alexandri]
MASLTFQLLSDQEIIDMKRTRGIMACAECQKRKLKCNKKFPCSSCVRRGRGDICPTGDVGHIGRGRRVVRSETPHLTTAVDHTADWINQLKTAVATSHTAGSDVTHSALRDEPPTINNIGESSSECTPVQPKGTFAAKTVNVSGTESYFGRTAGPSAYSSGSASGDHAEYAPSFAEVIDSFPFDTDPPYRSRDTASCMENLLGQLPEELRAWMLYDIFTTDASWYITPVSSNELHELIVFIYNPESNLHELLPHTLAVVFFAFAAAALVDLSLSPYNLESSTYFDLGRSALALHPVSGSRDLHTIQALVLASRYYVTGGPRFNFDSSWTTSALAVGLCQTLRLHVEKEHLAFENNIAQRRRALFWEVRSMETYNALCFARPLTISAADISCEFPADTEQTMDSEGRTIPGYYHTKWRFTKEVTAPIAQAFTGATLPTYEEVLDLDRRLRQFMESVPFAHYARTANEKGTFLAYVQAHMIPRFAGNLMLYIHRGYFTQALKDRPLNPLDSTYAASFLAAYRGASMLIKSDARSCALYPDLFHRWWPIWKSLVNAAFIAGSIVSKCPTSEIAPGAFADFLTAVHLVEAGATHCFLAEGSLVPTPSTQQSGRRVHRVSPSR